MSDGRPQAIRILPDGGRRLRALRVLLEIKTVAELAQRVDNDRLTAITLGNIEAPSRPRQLWDYEASAIAQALGVRESFFTAPVEELGAATPD